MDHPLLDYIASNLKKIHDTFHAHGYIIKTIHINDIVGLVNGCSYVTPDEGTGFTIITRNRDYCNRGMTDHFQEILKFNFPFLYGIKETTSTGALEKSVRDVNESWHIEDSRGGEMKNIETVYGMERQKRLSKEERKKTPVKTKATSSVSFDGLIMECDNLLDIETSVLGKYKEWVKSETQTIIKITEKVKKLIPVERFTFYQKIIRAVFGDSVGPFEYIEVSEEKIEPNKKYAGKTEDELMLIFLRDAYIGTIEHLNIKLDEAKDIIEEKRRTLKDRKEKIKSFKNLYKNKEQIEEVLSKYDLNIASLDMRFDKISDRKNDLNEALDTYLGEDGYISQKESEIEQLKLAQELSNEIEDDFNTTLEVINNADILADTIVPGIKKLMSYRIPELVDHANFNADKERVFLEKKTSMLNS
jgi:hypothetical protein